MHIVSAIDRDAPCANGALSVLHTRIKSYFDENALVRDFLLFDTPDKVILALKERYQEQILTLGARVFHDPTRLPCYPYLGIYTSICHHESSQSYGIFKQSGFYGTTITQPAVYEDYLHDQLSLLMQWNETFVGVGISSHTIHRNFLPHSLSDDRPSCRVNLTSATSLPSHCHKDSSPLSTLNEHPSMVDYLRGKKSIQPLTLFSGARSDYSLSRLMHYCGTSAEHFQNFVILTNYSHYIDHFFQYARNPARLSQGYTEWAGPMEKWGPLTSLDTLNHGAEDRAFQMPAYHLKKPNKQGITLINIGVGPSNMKTITDHLAVLRSHCWILLGHCGGIEDTQHLGDFVIANAYVRHDHVLDDDVPLNTPIPAIADVQKALFQSGEPFFSDPAILRRHIRSGTILTTANRNWELRVQDFLPLIQSSRAIAVDMESATLAANAFRFSIPYGALLCVSDLPLHGNLKMPQSAQNFYQDCTQQHLMMGIHAMEILAACCPFSLHSRKLRGLDARAFR